MISSQLTVKDLTAACQNAQSEGVNSLVIQHNGVDYHVVNAAIVPQRNHSDLVLFAGEKIMPTAPTKLIFSFGKKAKSPPLHKTITAAVIATINQFVNKVDLKTLDEIKTALSEVNEHFENVDNDPNPFGFDLSGGAL